MRSTDTLPEIHLFEPSGYAGVFQHTCQLARELTRRGRRVVLHTGHEHEDVDHLVDHVEGLIICPCSWWPRRPGQYPAALRQTLIACRFVGRTLPHLVRSVPPGAVVHLEGIAAAGVLNVLTLAVMQRSGRRVVYSPHDLFSRRGPVDETLLRVARRMPHAVVVHSRADAARLHRLGSRVHRSPLIQLVPPPSEVLKQNWRQRWRASSTDKVVLFAGFIRPEKRLDLLIESARRWPPGRRLAVVGPDRGGWQTCERLATSHGIQVYTRLEFVDLAEFTAAIAAADLVVVPSERASQSGVLAVARQLQTPTVAADAGGQAELASRTFIPGDADDLSRAIDAELANDRREFDPADDTDEALHVHLRAYGGPI